MTSTYENYTNSATQRLEEIEEMMLVPQDRSIDEDESLEEYQLIEEVGKNEHENSVDTLKSNSFPIT